MKDCFQNRKKIRPRLYIPHGSDERHQPYAPTTQQTHPLYPTWFRWKNIKVSRHGYPAPPLYPTWFRWKHNQPPNQDLRLNLYIPHGSDERNIKKYKSVNLLRYFISHMVQMKEKVSLYCKRIPSSFISHMVQMKVTLSMLLSIFSIVFISHMVQMKDAITMETYSGITPPLYPTWFRWKITSFLALLSFCVVFISHMVQMKVDHGYAVTDYKSHFISHMVQMKETKGRIWKVSQRALYIPHGSDERKMLSFSKSRCVSALYPTWFRWKN